MSIATLADAKQYLNVTRTTDDSLIQKLLDSASLIVERATGLSFEPNPAFTSGGADTNPPVTISVWADPSNGLVQPRGPSDSWAQEALPTTQAVVTIPHARQITAVTINRGAITVSPITSDPPGAGYWTETDSRLGGTLIRRVGVNATAYRGIYDVQVTGRFGVVPAPADIVDAVLAMTARRYRERDAAWGDNVQLPEGGLVSYFRALPPAVRMVIDSYTEIAV